MNAFRKEIIQFALITGLCLLIAGIIRVWHNPYALEVDGAEQTYLAQWLELGNGIQPLLPTWIYHFTFKWLGHSLAVVILVRLLAVWGIYVSLFALGRQLLGRKSLALLTVFTAVFIFQFSALSLRQMHTVFVTLFVLQSWIWFFSILNRPQWWKFALFGVATGLSLLSKYNVVIHIGAQALVVLSIPTLRGAILRPSLLISIIMAIGIAVPHYTWLVENFMSVKSGVSSDLTEYHKSSLLSDYAHGFFTLFTASLAFFGLMLVMFFAFFGKWIKSGWRNEFPFWQQVFYRYFLICGLALIAVILFARATSFHEHWLQPYFIVSPIFLAGLIAKDEAAWMPRVKWFRRLALFTIVAIGLSYTLKSYLRIYLGTPNSVFNVPYKDIANAVAMQGNESILLTNDFRTAGHLKLLLPERKVLVLNDLSHLRLEKEAIQNAESFLFIWKQNPDGSRPTFGKSTMEELFQQPIIPQFLEESKHTFFYVYQSTHLYPVGITRVKLEF